MTDVTSANAVYLLNVPVLFPISQVIQGWSTDDAFMTDEVDTKELYRGIDGNLSAGLVLNPIPMTLTLSPDSPSNAIFDYWNGQELLNRVVYICSVTILLPSIATKWIFPKGVLRRYRPVPDAAKILRPRQYGLTFESGFPHPITGVA